MPGPYKASDILDEFEDNDDVLSASEYREAHGTYVPGNDGTKSVRWSVLGTRVIRPRGTIINSSVSGGTYNSDPSDSDPNGVFGGNANNDFNIIKEGGLIPGSTVTFSASMHSSFPNEQGVRSDPISWYWEDNQGNQISGDRTLPIFTGWDSAFNAVNGVWPQNNDKALDEMGTRTISSNTISEQSISANTPIIDNSSDQTTFSNTDAEKRRKHGWFVVARAYDKDYDIENLLLDGSNLGNTELEDSTYAYYWVNPYFKPYTTISLNGGVTQITQGKPQITFPTTTATVTGSLEPGDNITLTINNVKAKEELTGISLLYKWEIVDDPSGDFELPTTGTFTSTSSYKSFTNAAPNYTPTSGDYWVLQVRCLVDDGINEIYSDTVSINIKRAPRTLEYIKYNSFYSYIRNNNTANPSDYNPNLSGKISAGDLVIVASSWTLPNTSNYAGLAGQTVSGGRPRGIPNIISQNGFNNLLIDGVIHGTSYLGATSGKSADYYTPCYAGYQSNAATGVNQPTMMAAFWKLVDGTEAELDLFDDTYSLRNEETQVWIFRGGSGGQSIYGGQTITADVAYYTQTFSSGSYPSTKNTSLRMYGNPSTQVFYPGKFWDPQVPDQTNPLGRNGATLVFHFFTTCDPYFPSNHTSSNATNDYYGYHTIDSISHGLNGVSTANDVRSYSKSVHGQKWADGRTTSGLSGLRFAVGIRQLSGNITDQYDGVFYAGTNYSNNRWIDYNGDVKYKQYDVGMYSSFGTGTWNTSDPHTGATAVLNLWSYDPLYP